MSFRKLLALILSLLMLAGSISILSACGLITAECTEHADGNNDGKCDICNAAVDTETSACTEHSDADNNGKCDNCGADINIASSGKTLYTISVKTVAGMPLEGVTVYIHNTEGYGVCTLPAETNAEGIVTFELDTSSDYSIQLADVPNGYTVKSGETKADRYPMTATGAEIMLSSAPIKGEDFADSYEIGDIMHDFTIKDVNGKEYNLSDMLEEKRMVMLNFWYVDCSWCLKEFPGINASYKNYKDKIEVLAINDYGDNIGEIKDYPTSYFPDDNLILPIFRVEKNDKNLIVNKFANTGYPTTVIIDRYGVICMIEAGAIVGQSKWDKIFSHFTADEYEQKLITNSEDLTPAEIPTVEWGGSEGIANAFSGSNISVDYSPETDEADALYSWPFIPTTVGSINAVMPSNKSDNSYAILYADVKLKPGQAVMFDYFTSCEYGNDKLTVLVDSKDICSLTGVNTANKTDASNWEQCCAYVDPRPITDSNKDSVETYRIAFAYTKNEDTSAGDDTVYLKNLRTISVSDIPTETYIFRYAATDATSRGDGYNTYVDYILHTDGFYHVKNADGTVGPLLLANFLNYSNFDSKETMSQRVTSDGELIVDGIDRYNYWMIYANSSSNSKINGYTPVNEELKEMLEAYCEKYRRDAGKSDHEDLWLQLCIYYDAYGKDENGEPTAPVENPIKGLTTMTAFETEFDPSAPGDKATFSVTYESVIMPRGYLYRFVPTVSGVYRVTSKSKSEVTGWIFTGSSHDWADMGDGERTLLVGSETEERFCPELIITNNKGEQVRDNNNLSMVTYMEAGKEYFIDIAYYDLYEVGTFEFEIKYVGESFDAFVMASPGPITFIEGIGGSMGQLIAIGIDYDFKEDADGIKYAYQVIERDELGNPTRYGEKLYADFYYPTIPFPSQSIVEIAEKGAFDFSISDLDVDAIGFLDQIRADAKSDILAKWVSNGTAGSTSAAESLWSEKKLDDILKAIQSGEATSSFNASDVALAEDAMDEAIYSLKTSWGKDNIGDEDWDELKMDDAIRGTFSSDDTIKQKQKDAIEDIEHLWKDIYKMDDVSKGKYHGIGEDMTEVINKYIALMDDNEDYPERQGCVAVTEELADLLSDLYSKYVFDDVAHDFLKFCFYYDQMGTQINE